MAGLGFQSGRFLCEGRLWALGLIPPCLSGSPGDQMRLSAPASRGHLGRAAEESLRTRRLGMGLDIAWGLDDGSRGSPSVRQSESHAQRHRHRTTISQKHPPSVHIHAVTKSPPVPFREGICRLLSLRGVIFGRGSAAGRVSSVCCLPTATGSDARVLSCHGHAHTRPSLVGPKSMNPSVEAPTRAWLARRFKREGCWAYFPIYPRIRREPRGS